VWRRHDQYNKDGTWDAILAAVLTDAADADLIDWAVSVDSTVNRTHQHATNLPRDTGDPSNDTNLSVEPADHGIGRSRGGLSTMIHHLVDGAGMPLVVLTAPGLAGDAPMFSILMGHLRVASSGREDHARALTNSAATRPTRRKLFANYCAVGASPR